MFGERYRLLGDVFLVVVGLFFLTLPWLSKPLPLRGKPQSAALLSLPLVPETAPSTPPISPPFLSPKSPPLPIRGLLDPQAENVFVLRVLPSGTSGVVYKYGRHRYGSIGQLRGFLTGVLHRRKDAKILIYVADTLRTEQLLPLFALCQEVGVRYQTQAEGAKK